MGLFGRKKKAGQHTDPVCGMLVVETEAIGPDTVNGAVYYYCSTECQNTFHERTGTRRKSRERRRREAEPDVKA